MRSLVVVALLGMVARATAGPNDDASRADTLFDEAQQLKQAGNIAEACAKYGEALAHNHNAVGTLLNVALCDEQVGKVASAVRLFVEARDLARERNLEEHRVAAETHLLRDEPLLAHIAIAFNEPPTRDTKIVIDDEIIAVAAANDVPVDPGTRTITVTAPGRVPYEVKVLVARTERKAVAIPKLGYPVTFAATRGTVGKIATFSGAGLIVTGILLGVDARARYRDQISSGACSNPAGPICTQAGFAALNRAVTLGNAGTVVGAVGVATLVVGGFLWVFAPRESQHVAVVPVATVDQVGLAAIGRF